MFDCGGKGQFSAGKTEFIRLGDLDSRMSTPDKSGINRRAFNIEGPTHISKTAFRSSKGHMIRGSERFKFLGHSFNFGTSKEVFPEDLKESERKIFNPQDKFLQLWNRLFVFCCLVAVYVDPLFFYLPVTLSKKEDATCLSIDRKLAITSTTLRTVIDVVYILRIFFQFRTAYVAPSSRVFGRGELVIDPTKIAKRYLSRYAMMDFLAILPLPQVIIWRYLHTSNGSDVLTTKEALRFIVIFQYIPRLFRIFPLTSEVKRTSGALFQTAWAGALYYLLWFMLISHIVGAVWYLSSVDSQEACWRELCTAANISYSNIYCSNNYSTTEHNTWKNLSLGNLTLENKTQGISINCSAGSDSLFKFGIFEDAITNEIISFREFLPKYFYCLWWGLRNLSTLGQGLETSTEPREVMFSIAVAILGLILFALLIGNMQTYLQSLTTRLEEMRVKRRDSEHWMHHRLLPQELRKRVRRYDQYKWLETRGVDEETLLQSLPKDLRRDIKRHLCLDLVRKVHLFQKMDETLLDAICERLKPILCIENTYIVRESDPVDEMLFIIRGRLESVTTDGGRSGFFNRSLLKEGDFCGEELLTWALDPKSGSNLPSSTRTVNALTEVEAFALTAEDLKFVASQFRRLHSRQVQHTFRYFSQQWKTWAARFIQAAWRRYTKRKALEERRGEDEALGADDAVHGGSASLGAAIYVSRFATNALRGVKRSRNTKTTRELITLQKPPEPDFSVHE